MIKKVKTLVAKVEEAIVVLEKEIDRDDDAGVDAYRKRKKLWDLYRDLESYNAILNRIQ